MADEKSRSEGCTPRVRLVPRPEPVADSMTARLSGLEGGVLSKNFSAESTAIAKLVHEQRGRIFGVMDVLSTVQACIREVMPDDPAAPRVLDSHPEEADLDGLPALRRAVFHVRALGRPAQALAGAAAAIGLEVRLTTATAPHDGSLAGAPPGRPQVAGNPPATRSAARPPGSGAPPSRRARCRRTARCPRTSRSPRWRSWAARRPAEA